MSAIATKRAREPLGVRPTGGPTQQRVPPYPGLTTQALPTHADADD